MANWRYQIDFKDIWEWNDSVPDKTVYEHVKELGKRVGDRIVASSVYKHYEEDLEEIVEEFREAETIEAVDIALDTLYNWADWDHRCWIKTF